MAVAVLGDVGGQTQVYRDSLESIGVDPDTCILPDDLDLVQVGDVVRMNPHEDLDSLGCVEISDKLLKNNPGRFHQLLGNHDLALLGGALDPLWQIDDLPESRPFVERWWAEGEAKLAVTLKSTVAADEDILITHAGLGYNYWNALGSADALGTTKTLNSFVGTPVKDYEVPGWLVNHKINVGADTGWALVGLEFQDTWKDKVMPFHQIHGHSVMLQWTTRKYWDDMPQHLIDSTEVNFEERYTITRRPDNRWVRSVDWMLGNQKIDYEWPVLILTGYQVS